VAWRPHGHVKVNARSPRAAGVCDRCGRIFQHNTLRFQFDFSGLRLQNLRILVCDAGCYDVPQRQLGAKILSPDPLPIFNARPEPFTTTGLSYQETNTMCSPPSQFTGGDFSSDFNNDFSGGGDPSLGLQGDGPQMTMPDGTTLMVMPANPPGIAP